MPMMAAVDEKIETSAVLSLGCWLLLHAIGKKM